MLRVSSFATYSYIFPFFWSFPWPFFPVPPTSSSPLSFFIIPLTNAPFRLPVTPVTLLSLIPCDFSRFRDLTTICRYTRFSVEDNEENRYLYTYCISYIFRRLLPEVLCIWYKIRFVSDINRARTCKHQKEQKTTKEIVSLSRVSD